MRPKKCSTIISAVSIILMVITLAMSADASAAGDGYLLRRDNTDDTCGGPNKGCHNLKIHNSTNTESSRPAWGTTFTCRTCHTPHNTKNIYLIKEVISTPNSGNRSVDFRYMTTGQEDYGLVNSLNPGSGPCEVCHTDTKNADYSTGTVSVTNGSNTVTGSGTSWSSSNVTVNWEIKLNGTWYKVTGTDYGAQQLTISPAYSGPNLSGASYTAANPRFRNTGSGRGAAGTEHYVSLCIDCHPHSEGFKPGESGGNSPCNTCHSALFNPMNSANNYHHYMNNAQVTNLASGSKYPQLSQPPSMGDQTDANRRCLMCHVDHDIFRPDLNSSNTIGRSANLRTTISIIPTTTSGYTNTDFLDSGDGGLCISCHNVAQAKSYAQPDGTTQTPRIPYPDVLANQISAYNLSKHQFAVPSTFTKDSSTFNANCLKCHNDTMTKTRQSSTNRFGLHDSTHARIAALMGLNADSGTAAGTQSSTTLQDTSKNWALNAFAGSSVKITGGTGAGQVRTITANTSNTLYVTPAWATTPDATSTYAIPADQLEESLCLQCHSGGVAGNDYYNSQAMSQEARSLQHFFKPYTVGTASFSQGSDSAYSTVTGTGTSWADVTGTSATFTHGSKTVTGISPAVSSDYVGRYIKNDTQGVWYQITGVQSNGTQLTISPAATADATGTWTISLAGTFIKSNATGAWYKIRSVVSDTQLEVFPGPSTNIADGPYTISPTYGHPIYATNSVHKPSEGTGYGWNVGSNRHAECEDCHNPHAVREGNHDIISGNGNIGNANLGVWGVDVSYSAYTEGTASFTSGSTTVVGTGTNWSSDMVGRNIKSTAPGSDNIIYTITAVTSPTELTINKAPTSSFSGSYVIGDVTPDYTAGTVSVTQGSTTVTGTGTNWTEYMVGRYFTVISKDKGDGQLYRIVEVVSPTQITLDRAFAGASGNGRRYKIVDRGEGYRMGTATFTQGSTTVTGSGTSWTSAMVGRYISNRGADSDGKAYLITSVESPTSLTISTPYAGTDSANTAYAITNVGYSRVEVLLSQNKQYQLCLKCHSSYSWANSTPPLTTFFSYDATNKGAVLSTATQFDVGSDFNPYQYAHHAVMGPGNNQPPADANPNWSTSPGRKASTFTDKDGVVKSNPNTGLDNTFVDGWGAQSIVTCTDCHDYANRENTDPWGPHGSANAWTLKGIDPNVTVTTVGAGVLYPNQGYYAGSPGSFKNGVEDTGDTKNFCLNCHRADVYGMVSLDGSSTPPTYANLARVTHPVDTKPHSNAVKKGALTRWGIFCMQCHGGESIGAIHGTNAGKGPQGNSYRGKRFLAGATWYGHTRASGNGSNITCWTKANLDSVNTCTQGHGGTKASPTVNYVYDPGAD